ncbi:IclR family transcriptional regulator [Glycomyces sp. MUSA5-2]|uniref:IclR family transcriptional regulator n=1 Tax=Glycomyces sp. MUSA5-2 TaxID=2053002 RepID=UPI00300A30FF
MARGTGVQSVERALALLEALDTAGDAVGIGELAAATGLPAGTIHRLLRTLVDRGWAHQLPDRRYMLGTRIARMGASANALLGRRARPVLRAVAVELGETANLAVLAADAAEYVAQVAGTHSMRMFTEVGSRVPLHSTGVGKALLSRLPDETVRDLLRRMGMPRFTDTTITDPERMVRELAAVRERGYAVDDGEMELGVRCVAVPFTAGVRFAISVSGPAPRMTDALVARAAAALTDAAARLRDELDDRHAAPDRGGEDVAPS